MDPPSAPGTVGFHMRTTLLQQCSLSRHIPATAVLALTLAEVTSSAIRAIDILVNEQKNTFRDPREADAVPESKGWG